MAYREITEKVKQKISETKSETGRQKVLEGAENFSLEPSTKKLTVPTHRKHKYISIDEYQKLLQEGKTTLEVCQITSKHLVYFYNAMLKGRITLTKENFVSMYEQGMSLNEIAKQSETPREYITQLREFYGIKRKGATYQRRLKEERPLSDEAKSIVIGSLLGDCHIHLLGYFSEKHSQEQLAYLQWKASFFPDITTDKSWGYRESIDKRSGNLIKTHSFRTRAHSFLYEMRKKWYKKVNGGWTKIVPDDIGDMLDELALAVWFMDDGTTDWGYRKGIKKYAATQPQCQICTDSFTFNEVMNLSFVLSEKFSIESQVKFRDGKTKPRIRFSSDNSTILLNFIKNEIHESLKYKVEESAYVQKLKP